MNLFSIKINQLFTVLTLFLLSTSITAQTIYVKGDVAGGDGTSWATAFQYLDDAIAVADSGEQIWVAAGTYYPGGAAPSRDTFFNMKNGVDIYGGFAGTETMLSERDVASNVVNLSGDFDQNDTDDEWITPERLTNTRNVFIVDTTVQDAILDGFTISHGNADTTTANQAHRGGGMLIFGAPTIRNCTFEQNYAILGGGAYPRFINASGTTFENCTFRNNLAGNGGGMYVFDNIDVVIDNCNFTGNIADFGASMFTSNAFDLVITSCNFTENLANTSAAAIYADFCTIFFEDLVVRDNMATFGGFGRISNGEYAFEDCLFNNNTGTTTGGAHLFVDAEFSMTNCSVDSNSTTGFGGGIYAITCLFTIENSSISNNLAGSGAGEGGGGLYAGAFDGDTTRYIITNTTIASNDAPFASGIASYGDGTLGIIEDCSFVNNSADNGGGGIGCSFGSSTSMVNCEFLNNSDVGYGGAIFGGGNEAGTRFSAKNCIFEGNSANSFGGGAVSIITDGFYQFDSCYFSGNTSVNNFGGAINYSPDSFALNSLLIDKCEFLNNNGFDQGGALNVSDGNVTIFNSLFNFNKVTPDPTSGAIQGRGGAFANNANFGDSSVITLVHCTVVNSDGDFAAGISQWEADNTASAIVRLQNNIFNNFGTNYAIEEGDPEVESYGGNLSNGTSFEPYFSGTNDSSSVIDFGFVDEYAEIDFRLLPTSLARDNGVSSPFSFATDIGGLPRDDMPDTGAFEWDNTVSTRPEIGDNNLLILQPNPTITYTQLSLEHDFIGDYQLRVYNASGQLIYEFSGEKNTKELQQTIPTAALSSGIYEVSIQFNHEVLSRKLIKQ